MAQHFLLSAESRTLSLKRFTRAVRKRLTRRSSAFDGLRRKASLFVRNAGAWIITTFRPVVERWYLACCDDAGVTPAEVPLKLEDLALEVPRTFRSEFAAVTPPPAVRITWNGLASLWAFSQAVVRVGRPMFEAQRTADPTAGPPQLAIGGELEEGLHLFELSSRLSRNKFDGWVDWAPVPDPDAVGASLGGNRTFENALGWIMRHELAHLRLNHHAVAEPLPILINPG